MFGWGRKAAVKQRARLLARMIGLIMHGLKTKPFSNPGKEPDAFRSRYQCGRESSVEPLYQSP